VAAANGGLGVRITPQAVSSTLSGSGVKTPVDVSMKPPCVSRFGYVQSITGSRHAAAFGEGDSAGGVDVKSHAMINQRGA
jgi:hypothetical protein